MRADEGEEQIELLFELDEHVVLFEALGRGSLVFGLADGDVLGILEREARQILDALGLGGREEHGLAVARQVLDDGVQGAREAHVEDAIGLVEDEDLEVGGVESKGLIHVLQQTTGSGD